jgi:DNA-binding CsgD family transcriptional regulator
MGVEDRATAVYERIGRLAHAGLDSETVRFEATAELHQAVPFEAWCAPTADPATLLVGRAVGMGFPLGDACRAFEIEYQEADFNKLEVLALGTGRAAGLALSTSGDLQRSARWRDVFRPIGLGDELRTALMSGGHCWGYLALHREQASRPFSPSEVAFVARVSPLIADGLREGLVAHDPKPARPPQDPALVVLGPGVAVDGMTPAGERWLREADNSARTLGGPLPDVVYAVVARLRASQEGSQNRSAAPRVRFRTRSGHWAVVSSQRLSARSGPEKVAVTLGPAKAEDLAPLIARAYHLTKRERELVGLVLRGLSTAELAECMHISMTTVQDHAQAVFAKVGVRSRRELCARVFGELNMDDDPI